MKLRTRGEVVFEYVNYFLLLLAILVCLIPVLNIVAKSFSDESSVVAGDVGIWPIHFTTEAYHYVLSSPKFLSSFSISVLVTVIGTLINVTLTVFTGYALSRRRLKGQKVIMMLFVFTMIFQAGILPTYLIVKQLGLLNSIWSLILPGLVSPFNMIIVRLYFCNIPDSLEESGKMDGAGNLRILFHIMIPLAMPVIATTALFCAVEYWNSYFDALMYISKQNLLPLQVYLREVIFSTSDANNNVEMVAQMQIAQESIRGAVVVAATLPIVLVYPFLQRYFVKGIVLGAVKG
ncbi:carbohydrate ABC transporter permease [Paenibacillus methanolicus]|uniref:Putative aldouronate transport system permease protein n=1 Tax=Paenibacillus methanolicus TaxID=582686 RepID=A0A5S5CLJ8_9BACL|nr:carbohydrate ABC transporter permease [Paenibacillus methanolicus]TYP79391.1 putative aldouronate transport system permease protein [Paenibacillus methanolicus]